ncbi:hypothetical protein F5146DRAFT_996283 [Armillaria mellea]|nr:hypothetical protein F5146DRAFT_996283 [Armillaria mellea]
MQCFLSDKLSSYFLFCDSRIRNPSYLGDSWRYEKYEKYIPLPFSFTLKWKDIQLPGSPLPLLNSPHVQIESFPLQPEDRVRRNGKDQQDIGAAKTVWIKTCGTIHYEYDDDSIPLILVYAARRFVHSIDIASVLEEYHSNTAHADKNTSLPFTRCPTGTQREGYACSATVVVVPTLTTPFHWKHAAFKCGFLSAGLRLRDTGRTTNG